MTTRSQRDALKVQLLDTLRIKELAADHPLMAPALEEREKDLQAQIDALPLEDKKPPTAVLIDPKPDA